MFSGNSIKFDLGGNILYFESIVIFFYFILVEIREYILIKVEIIEYTLMKVKGRR